MPQRAAGPFDVKVVPQPPDTGVDTAPGRFILDKHFHGDIEATSKGQMLAAQSEVAGSAGYVAIEKVTGSLHGRSGTFVLQHYGLMNRGKPSLTIDVVPDSGTGELSGLSGTMEIVIESGKHSYVFDYTLSEPTSR